MGRCGVKTHQWGVSLLPSSSMWFYLNAVKGNRFEVWGVSRLWRKTYCCWTRGIVFGLVLMGELGVEEGSWTGTLTGLEKGVRGA